MDLGSSMQDKAFMSSQWRQLARRKKKRAQSQFKSRSNLWLPQSTGSPSRNFNTVVQYCTWCQHMWLKNKFYHLIQENSVQVVSDLRQRKDAWCSTATIKLGSSDGSSSGCRLKGKAYMARNCDNKQWLLLWRPKGCYMVVKAGNAQWACSRNVGSLLRRLEA